MARPLRSYHWAEESLYGEAACNEWDIIVEGSDIDDSPPTKAERRRRREVIGRRYLLGHVPFIQSTSLRGPFGHEYGWVNPWRRNQPRSPMQPIPSMTIHEDEGANNINALAEGGPGRPAVRECPGREINDKGDTFLDDDTWRYDADNEDNVSEQMHDGETHSFCHGPVAKDIGPEPVSILNNNKSQQFDSDEDVLQVSQEDLELLIRHNSIEFSDPKSQLMLKDGMKRKADASWLKGASVFKRSRYELLEYSSPTPATGRCRRCSSLRSTEMGRPPGRSSTPKSRNANSANAEAPVAHESRTLPAGVGRLCNFAGRVVKQCNHCLVQEEQENAVRSSHVSAVLPSATAFSLSNTDHVASQNPEPTSGDRPIRRKNEVPDMGMGEWQDIPQPRQKSLKYKYKKKAANAPNGPLRTDTRSISAVKGGATAPVPEEIEFDTLGLEEVDELCQVSGLALESANLPISTPIRGEGRQLETVELCVSDLDAEDITALKGVKQLSLTRARSDAVTPTANNSHKVANHPPARSKTNADGATIHESFDGDGAFRNTPSPAQTGSFEYRKATRKSKMRKTSPRTQMEDAKSHATNEEANFIAYATSSLSSNRTESGPKRVILLEGVCGLSVRKVAGDQRLKRQETPEKCGTPSMLPDRTLGFEASRSPSPDPLCSQVMDDRRKVVPQPESSRAIVDELADDHLKVDDKFIACITTTQATPSSRHRSSKEWRSSLRASSDDGAQQQLTSDAWKAYLERPASPTCALQGLLSNSGSLERSPQLENETKLTGSGDFDHDRKTSSQPEVNMGYNGATVSPHDTLQLSLYTTHVEGLDPSARLSQSAGLAERTNLPYGGMPKVKDAGALGDLDTLKQSPWTAVVETLQPASMSWSGSNDSPSGEDDRGRELDVQHQPIDDGEDKAIPIESNGGPAVVEDDLRTCQAFINYMPEQQGKTGRLLKQFLSTQILVDATTANPWTNALTKPRSRRSSKRVSFGPLPSNDTGNIDPESLSRSSQRLRSPPPPPGTLHLTHLDDHFHYKLKATEKLEVTEESLTKFINTPWDEIPPMMPHAKPPPSSPSVDAMAEAFIAADRQSLYKKSCSGDKTQQARPTRKAADSTNISAESWRSTVRQGQDTRSPSPFDASFSIAPSGKVTAVRFGNADYDIEDNLDAVIEDMGSFLEGWDVDLELKKAKGNKSKGSVCNGRKREWLSGVSNR